ncbi:MAG TPA: hypothetical protein DCG06_15430, partial [Deltaproteobacteria bacterium]|nr:hypothetical protein [Deltaproteobacteria bacterium]
MAASNSEANSKAGSTQNGASDKKKAPTKPTPRRKTVAKSGPTITVTRPKAPSRADAGFRLSRDILPVHYQIHLVPDLNRGHFRGEALIEIQILKATSTIELHAADMDLDHAQIVPTGGTI